MSPKDLCTIPFLDKVIDAGVKVLKIEGRARPPEYVKTVSLAYNEAIDACLNNTFSKEKIEGWLKKLGTVFNRGFWDGYYLGRKFGEWNDRYGSKATKRKRYIAQATNYFSKLGVAEFLVQSDSLKIGDEVLLIGPTTGVIEMTINEMRKDLGRVDSAKKGDIISIPVIEKIRRADKLYLLEEVL
jgi:putative protease